MPETTSTQSLLGPDPSVKRYHNMPRHIHELLIATVAACPRYRAELEALEDARGRLKSLRAAGKYCPRQEREMWERVEATAVHRLAILAGEVAPDEELDEDCGF